MYGCICPSMLAQSRHINISAVALRLETLETVFDDLPENEKKKIRVLRIFCNALNIKTQERNITCNDCLDTLREIRIPPEEIFVECRFRGQVINCKSAFREVVLNQNLCYTFNGLQYYRTERDTDNEIYSQAWTIDDGYLPGVLLEAYPRRASRSNRQYGLSVILKINKRDFDYTCDADIGFWIEYRTPNESPQFTTKFFTTRLGYSSTFALTPSMITTSSELRNYLFADRKCYFSDEVHLEFFKYYTQSNCEMNCENDFALKECGCLPLRAIENRRGADICGYQQIECLDHCANLLRSQDYLGCNCAPTCTSISYDSEVVVTKFNMSDYPDDLQKGFIYSELTFLFKENHFLASQRTELYGTTDFLANCGGILGLCMGVSVMSILEIVYFCTIRLFYAWQKGPPGSPISVVEELQSDNSGKRAGRFIKTAKELLEDYSTRTTIQGINFMADSGLSVLERLWWTIVFLISFFCCGSLIHDVFYRYDQTPLIITYENGETPISEIPYPAVTVCPQVVSKDIRHMYDDFKFKNLSLYALNENDINLLTAVAQVCDPDLFGDIDPKNNTNCERCSENLHSMMGTVYDVFTFCQLYNEFPCEEFLKETITEGGVCYTFNGMEVFRGNSSFDETSSNWTLDGGYTASADDDVFIFPQQGTNRVLVLDLYTWNFMVDGFCRGPINGFNVYLHLPNEMPQIFKYHYLVPFSQTVEIALVPRMIKSDRELRQIPVEKRQCYFNDERYLQFFRYYTQNNCETECVANLTVIMCGCQRFYMPRIPGVKYCGISDIKCYQSVIQLSVELNVNQTFFTDCNCLPACTMISFDTEINQIVIREEIVDYHFKRENMSVARLTLVFRDSQFVALERSQLYGITELLANCGGLLGLFLGFSLMSILELFYFCSIRLFFNFKNQLI